MMARVDPTDRAEGPGAARHGSKAVFDGIKSIGSISQEKKSLLAKQLELASRQQRTLPEVNH